MQSEPTEAPSPRLPAAHRHALLLAGALLLGSFALGIADNAREWGSAPSIDLEPLRRGQAYFAAGQLREAAREFESAASILTTDPAPLLALATTLGALGEAGPQLEVVREAALRAPDDARAQLALGTALAAAGETAEALVALERSVQLDPRGIEAHLNLGIVELQQRRPAAALEHFETALGLDSQHAVARAAAAQARELLEQAPSGVRER